jgi:allophanate hydrolase
MSPDLSHSSLDLDALRRLYSNQLVTPLELVGEAYRRIRAARDSGVWTALVPEGEALRHADALTRQAPERLPLFGVPFSVKDNIHVAGLPTTAGRPAFSHLPDKSATLVVRMQAAGAILIGKNTMDQFATGLVGIRSPVHLVNTFDSSRIPGGSSSGSAVAVALGLVGIALGSDTGGSGRVPAALNNIVGFKPTPGVLSTAGMVYANRSFDCVPIFAPTCEDAAEIFEILNGADDADPFQLDDPNRQRPLPNSEADLTIGVPGREILDLDCDNACRTAFEAAIFRAIGRQDGRG